jgi:hypothetical protein
MAKKQNFSHISAQEALEAATSSINAENLPYILLSTFCGYGEASLQRVRDGRDNKSKEPGTILIKDKFVYRPFCKGKEPMDTIIALKDSSAVTRQNPRLYITCDGTSIVAYDPKDDDLYDGPVDTLWRDFEFFKPLAGIEKFRNYEEAEADVKTAELMAKIYDDICRYNDFRDEEVKHHINVFMSRLLFCFFAEDTGLFKENQFTKAIEDNTAIDGSDLADFIDRLFVIMSTDDKGLREQQTNKVIADFPYVNGGLFLQRYPIPVLSRRARLLMIQCGKFQWSEINPDIFGSMTQAIVSPEERSELGIHYTSVPNIMKVIQPLFLDDLVADFLRSRNDVKALNALLVRMSKIKFFDPACGSGNFLIISYKRVRELEIEIWKRLRELGSPMLPFSDIALTQFYGIELDEYACDTATLSLWLAEHQMNNKFRAEFNTSPNPLPLRPSGHIYHGNACTTSWESVCPHEKEDDEIYVMGNPPYLGTRNQEEWHKSDMNATFGPVQHGMLDYIGCWFYNGARYMRGHVNTRTAFVSTNSITQGIQVQMMWNPIFEMGMEIQFAHKTFTWSNNAKNKAAVFCVIIGYGLSNRNMPKFLYEGEIKTTVEVISPTLSDQGFSGVQTQSTSISGLRPILKGSLPADENNLTVYPDDRVELLNKYPELDSLIKRFIGSQEFLRSEERYCLWIPENKKSFAYSIPELARRFALVAEMRRKSKKEATRRLATVPYRFAEDRFNPAPAILIPVVSSQRREYIPIGFVPKDTVVYYSSFAVYNADLFDFAVLTSKMHNVWMRATAGRLKSDFRYSATLCYNTFPFPRLNQQKKDELAGLAKEILLVRAEHTEMTLGDMYNPDIFPDDLRAAHYALDLAVERCYREKPFESDEERLEFLFKQYIKLTTDKSTLWRI